MEAPKFTNCPTDVVVANPYGFAEMDMLQATDNSGANSNGSLKITISPPGFSLTTPIAKLPNGTTLPVTYTATDLAGNVGTCSFEIRTRGMCKSSLEICVVLSLGASNNHRKHHSGD